MTHTDQSRAEFDSINLRDYFGGPLSYRERDIAFMAWQAALNYAIASNPDGAASAEAGLRDCGTLPEQSSGAELPEPVAHINQNGVIHEAGYDWSSDNYLSGLYTEQQVRALLAAPAVPQGWIAVGERLPEPGRPVLLDIGKKHPIRAMWAARFTLEAGDDDPDWGEYDEDGDMYYCPQGWYEWNEHEDTHWRVHADPIRWAELTQPPKEQADAQ